MESQTQDRLIIFTDMDGSLLDHETYSAKPAEPVLAFLEEHDIPVIACTSKTRAELIHLRKSLRNRHPFIIENGAAVVIPVAYFTEKPEDVEELGGFWVKRFVHSRQYWLSLIAHTRFSFDKFRTFSDSTVTDIVNMTGLSYDDAVRASKRHYGEPVLWLGTEEEKQQFIAEMTALGAKVLQGGRFMHVSGDCNKGIALTWLRKQYKDYFDCPIITLAIGDSQNDVAMLEIADIALLIPSPSHSLPVLERTEKTYVASEQGPTGWANSVSRIINSLNII